MKMSCYRLITPTYLSTVPLIDIKFLRAKEVLIYSGRNGIIDPLEWSGGTNFLASRGPIINVVTPTPGSTNFLASRRPIINVVTPTPGRLKVIQHPINLGN